MIQRSPTLVARAETVGAFPHALPEAAVKAGITTDHADHRRSLPLCAAARGDAADGRADEARRCGAFYARLSADRVQAHLRRRRVGIGPCISAAARATTSMSARPSSSPTARSFLCSGVEVARLTEHAVVLTDGREIRRRSRRLCHRVRFDEPVGGGVDLAGGRRQGRASAGARLADRQDPGPWEGELRNMEADGAGRAMVPRWQSRPVAPLLARYLALQLKACLEGLPTPVYGRARSITRRTGGTRPLAAYDGTRESRPRMIPPPPAPVSSWVLLAAGCSAISASPGWRRPTSGDTERRQRGAIGRQLGLGLFRGGLSSIDEGAPNIAELWWA